MKVLILGDAHGQWWNVLDAVHDAYERFAIGAAIQVGDFGFFKPVMTAFTGIREPRFPVPLHVIDGNHEDHSWLSACRNDGTAAGWARDLDLHLHDRGDVLDLAGCRIGLCGGALHADRAQHGSLDKGTTNWLTDRQADAAATAFAAASVSVVVTHSCPHSIGVGMQGSAALFVEVERHIRAKGFNPGPPGDCGEPALTRLWHHLNHKPRTWLFGHFHVHHHRVVDGTDFVCVGSTDVSDGVREKPVYLLDTGDGSISTSRV